METAWVRSIRRQCRNAQVPFFFKQWGGVRKKENGRLLDGRTYDEFPNRILDATYERNKSLALVAEIKSAYAV